MKIMRSYEEIYSMLNILDRKRNEEVGLGYYNVALALGAQIELLKWILHLENKNQTEKEEKQEVETE